MKFPLAILAAALVASASPPVAADVSWNPLKDVENALPQSAPNESEIIQARHQVREMSQDALASLYEILPGAQGAIERSAGYAVFSTFGVKLLFAGGTTGKGMVVNKRTGRQTFMKMAQVQGGLGFGVDEPADLRFRQRTGAAQLRRSRLGIRRPGQRFGDGGRPGRDV